MRLILVTVFVIAYFTSTMASDNAGVTTASSQELIGKLAAGNVAFTKNLYDIIRKKDGNVFFSPISMELALMLVHNGADGNTAAEIQKALGLPLTKEETLLAGEAVMNLFQSNENVTLKAANALFLQKNFEVKDSFVASSSKHLAAGAQKLDFSNNVDAAKVINSFVDEHTNHKITELFKPDAFDALTKVVLVNAVYFLGLWDKKFKEIDTVEDDFHLNEKEKVKVNFMTQTNDFEVAVNNELKFTLINLPYVGSDLKMVLIVPHEVNGLKDLENRIQELDLVKLSQETRKRKVNLKMPKFKLEQTIDLKDILIELGMKDMFDSQHANFSGISEKDKLYVSKGIQKTYIEVDEKGTEAAAATGFTIRLMSASIRPDPILNVTADRPFLFFIQDNSGFNLFFGRFSSIPK